MRTANFDASGAVGVRLTQGYVSPPVRAPPRAHSWLTFSDKAPAGLALAAGKGSAHAEQVVI